jgi:hypothetical protein
MKAKCERHKPKLKCNKKVQETTVEWTSNKSRERYKKKKENNKNGEKV